MEAAIRTPEILDLVFQHLRFTEDLSVYAERAGKAEFLQRWSRKKATLLHAALVCKAFFQPAMANLWWTVDGIMPFIKLLPHIYSRNSQSGYHYHAAREWYLDQELDEENLERFDFYAKLVTHIIDLSRTGEDNVGTILIQLAEIRPSSRCFPRLRTVRTNSYNPDPLLFFTSPTLESLKLRGFWTEDKFKTMCGLVSRLPRRSPDLQVLDVPYIPNLRAMEAILRLPDLRHLSAPNIAFDSLAIHDFLKYAAELPRLEKLDITMSPAFFDETELLPTTETSPAWPALKSISTGGTPTNIIPLIKHVKSAYIEEVNFRLACNDGEEHPSLLVAGEVSALAQSVRTHLSSSLKSVSMGIDSSDPIYAPTPPGSMLPKPTHATIDFINILLSMPSLETVLIDQSLYVPNLTDAFLSSIVQSWPRLTKLSIPSSGSTRHPPFTFAGVQALVAGLPHLANLSVEFIASGSPAPGLQAPQLKWINVRSSPLWNKRETALNLSRAFPNLETLQYQSHDGPTKHFSTLWKEVAAWLPLLTGKFNPINCDEETDLPPRAEPPSPTGASGMSPGNPYLLPNYNISDSESEALDYESEY